MDRKRFEKGSKELSTAGYTPPCSQSTLVSLITTFSTKRINHKVVRPKQVRASVITQWLSEYNIREVQYMAGHRFISSTERYLQDDLENLQEMIENLHPIS